MAQEKVTALDVVQETLSRAFTDAAILGSLFCQLNPAPAAVAAQSVVADVGTVVRHVLKAPAAKA